MLDYAKEMLTRWGLEPDLAGYAAWVIAIIAVLLLAAISNFVAKRILLSAVSLLIRKTKTKWDDALLEYRVFHRASHIAPALVIYWFSVSLFGAENFIQQLSVVYILVVAATVVSAFLSATYGVYTTLEVARHRPIKGFIQLARIILFVFVGVFTIAVLFNQSPLGILGGLGALTAVLILVFKDTILGLVASFQISTSNMVQIGDWIEFPKYGADGDVIDITLHTIKVQNWNKTISTIPTYALISDSFMNWRGMEESGGRRIKRAVLIDMTSIRFCDQEMIERFSKYQYITEYIQKKKAELAQHNEDDKIDTSFLVNGRHMTNVGTFRAYLVAYLRNHPQINQDMTFLVRHLPPTENGLPIQIYVFSSDQRWANYEAIQADIFDHILAVLPMFDLRVFQRPAGHDLSALAAGTSGSASAPNPPEGQSQ